MIFILNIILRYLFQVLFLSYLILYHEHQKNYYLAIKIIKSNYHTLIFLTYSYLK